MDCTVSADRPKVQKTPPPTPSPQPVGAKGPTPSPVVRIECSRSEQCPRGFKCVQKRLCVPEEELCEPGWHYNKDNDFCYFVGVGSFNYSQAVEYCASDCGSKVVWFDQSSFPKFQTEWLWVNNSDLVMSSEFGLFGVKF
ncbi:unnamed protein product [Anisakis simplex]|uniref:Uncharacterized protein n=1 Tax=Anisakis simplex TaxID=6269 RepID=A0A3P6NIJ6_ANISI|nr:unnamed protein product [Anisakis simplex]